MAADESKGFAEMLAEYDQTAPAQQGRRRPPVGSEVSGRVVAIDSNSVFVDVGAKTEGVIDRGELLDEGGMLTVEIGSTVTARVAEADDGSIVLRKRMGRGADAASELAQAKETGIPVIGTVTAVNKGGVDVDVAGVRAFCAISQLDDRFVEDASSYVGRKLEFRVTRYEAGRGGSANVVVSRKALLAEQNAVLAAETRARLSVGAVVSGRITRLMDYGAFVDLGGLEGMLHVSEMGFGRVGHPSEVLSEGQAVEVKVLKIESSDDPKRKDRIGLSLKALQDDPWDDAMRALAVGQKLSGKVARLEQFGAFVTIAAGVEGLVHVSEIDGARRIAHAREALKVGEDVEVVIKEIDTQRHRVALSMKAVQANDEAAQAKAYRPASSGSLGTFADLLKKKLDK
jgi:small subunit ribosomal protein S1